jgi:hypothetical protein
MRVSWSSSPPRVIPAPASATVARLSRAVCPPGKGAGRSGRWGPEPPPPGRRTDGRQRRRRVGRRDRGAAGNQAAPTAWPGGGSAASPSAASARRTAWGLGHGAEDAARAGTARADQHLKREHPAEQATLRPWSPVAPHFFPPPSGMFRTVVGGPGFPKNGGNGTSEDDWYREAGSRGSFPDEIYRVR